MVALDELATTDEEHFHIGMVLVLGQGDHIFVCPRRRSYLLALGHPIHRLDLIAKHCRPLKVEPCRGLLHLAFQTLEHYLLLPLEEEDDLVYELAVFLLAYLPATCPHATINVIIEARAGLFTGDWATR